MFVAALIIINLATGQTNVLRADPSTTYATIEECIDALPQRFEILKKVSEKKEFLVALTCARAPGQDTKL